MPSATKLPTSTESKFFYWVGQPTLTSGLSASVTDTTIYWSIPPKDETGTILTGGFSISVTNKLGNTEQIWVPAGTVSADGLSAVGVVRGIKSKGLDYTAGSASYVLELDGGSVINCVISPQVGELIRSVLQGLIASGASSFIFGTDAAGTITLKRSTGTGTSVGFMRWSSVSSKTEYSNDGTNWIAIDDTVASVLFKISATDSSPGYGLTKLVSGSGITITQGNIGGNETLTFTLAQGVLATPVTYTPAYLTGGTNAQSTYTNWLAVLDGSFRITIDGVARSIIAINFTGVTSMNDVAAKIQTAIRAVTSGAETVAWSTNHFVITSGITTSSSAITVTTAGASGTDISGAGANDWMDSDTGHGTATATVLNQTADAGKIPLLNANGRVNGVLLNLPDTVTSTAAELNKLSGTSANVTAANLNTVTGGGNAEAVHTHTVVKQAVGVADFSSGVPSATTIAHGFGRAPKYILLAGANASGSGTTSTTSQSNGQWTASAQGCVYNMQEAAAYCNVGNSNTYALYVTGFFGGNFYSAYATVSVDTTNITLTWNRTNAGFNLSNVNWSLVAVA